LFDVSVDPMYPCPVYFKQVSGNLNRDCQLFNSYCYIGSTEACWCTPQYKQDSGWIDDTYNPWMLIKLNTTTIMTQDKTIYFCIVWYSLFTNKCETKFLFPNFQFIQFFCNKNVLVIISFLLAVPGSTDSHY
jgi:hypothetical protein